MLIVNAVALVKQFPVKGLCPSMKDVLEVFSKTHDILNPGAQSIA